MARNYTVEQIQKKLDIAKKRRELQQKKKTDNPKAYAKRTDTQPYFCQSAIDSDLYIKVNVSENTIRYLGGATESARGNTQTNPSSDAVKTAFKNRSGLVSAVPSGKASINQRHNSKRMYKLVMYYGDDAPTARTTEWGTRVVQFADKSIGNQKFFTCYVAPKPGTTTEGGTTVSKGAIETLIETYTELFGSTVNKQTGAKSTLSDIGKQLLGERGRATLYLGDQELASWTGA